MTLIVNTLIPKCEHASKIGSSYLYFIILINTIKGGFEFASVWAGGGIKCPPTEYGLGGLI